MSKNPVLAGLASVLLALLFVACTPDPEFREEAPLPALTYSPQMPFSVLSWENRTVTYMPGRRGEAAAYFGARSTEDQDWEIEHPTQGWLGFAASAATSMGAMMRDPEEGDVFLTDSATCDVDGSSPLAGNCSQTDTGSQTYDYYGWKYCGLSSNGGYCAMIYQAIGMLKTYSDSNCTMLVSSQPTMSGACSVEKP